MTTGVDVTPGTADTSNISDISDINTHTTLATRPYLISSGNPSLVKYKSQKLNANSQNRQIPFKIK